MRAPWSAESLPGANGAATVREAASAGVGTTHDESGAQGTRQHPRLLAAAALLGVFGLVLLALWLAAQPQLNVRWHPNARGQLELAWTGIGALEPHLAKPVAGIRGANAQVGTLDSTALRPSARWLIDDQARERHRQLHGQLAAVMATPSVNLHFADGTAVEVPTQGRSLSDLGAIFWLLAGCALALCLAAVKVLVFEPASTRNRLYALMALCQAGNLLFIAVESTQQLGLPRAFVAMEMPVRMAFDLITAAAAVHFASRYLRRAEVANAVALVAWVASGMLVAAQAAGTLLHAWWWTQVVTTLLCLAALALLSWACSNEPHPAAFQLRRIGTSVLATWMLLTLSLAVADRYPSPQQELQAVATLAWYVFLASLLLLGPTVSRSRQILREFSLLAAIGSVATSLGMMLGAVFSLGTIASMTLASFMSLAAYAGARRWILNRLIGSPPLSTERMFESLYRVAREIESDPRRAPELLQQLLRDLFEPLQAEVIEGVITSTRVTDDGSTLLVPLPLLAGDKAPLAGSIKLRFARSGHRLFTAEDARLTDRVVEQLRRAVAFDHAVEHGRNEERLRLAQDLHDDIGARLLTLMYKATSPEMEEYARHTLKDLKTLTRGLAASSHLLSHAAAEWKADLSQRLTAADVTLGWSFSTDRDILLTIVQWSALTRILRELVSNVIAHSCAQRVDIALQFQGGRLELTVTDNGKGSEPQRWQHGLGLGGVRKRVKQLGGEVEWREASPTGINCRVRVALAPMAA